MDLNRVKAIDKVAFLFFIKQRDLKWLQKLFLYVIFKFC